MKDWSNRHPIGAATKAAIDDRTQMSVANAAARNGSEALLRAQLRYGQHILPLALAQTVGAAIGLPRISVRAAAGDRTA